MRSGLLPELQVFIDRIPFVRPLGVVVEKAARGSVRLMILPKPHLLNHFGTYQAGSLFTLAEVTGGVAVGTFLNLDQNLLITKKGEIHFLKSSADKITAEVSFPEQEVDALLVELNRRRKADLRIDVVLTDEKLDTVGNCSFFYYVRLGIPRLFRGKNS